MDTIPGWNLFHVHSMQDSPLDRPGTCTHVHSSPMIHIQLEYFCLPCMMSVKLIIPLFPSKHNSFCVDHHHMVTHVNCKYY